MKDHKWLYKLLLMFTAFLWGSGFWAVEAALVSGWQAFPLLFMRTFIAGVIMLGLAGFYRFPWQKNKKMIAHCVLAGFVMWLGFATQIYGQQIAGVSKTAIYTSLYALMTPFIAYFVNKTAISLKVYAAIIIAFLSVVLVSYDGSGFSFGWGELLLVLASFSFAAHLVILENLGPFGAVFAISGIQLLTMAVCSLVASVVLREGLHTEGLVYVVYLALFCSGLAFLLQVQAQRYVDSATTGLILSFESLWGVVGAVVAFNEPLTWQILGGCMLMLIAIYVLEHKSQK